MVFIIAEAGINHNGSIETAHKLIDVAADCGANAAKFQTYNAEKLDPPGGRREMLRRYQLPIECYKELMAHCSKRQIEFMSTPFDTWSMAFLAERMNMRRIKIASGNLSNWPMLSVAKRLKGKHEVLLSTGMANLTEISGALEFIGKENVSLLHCTSAYPCPDDDANLNAIASLRKYGLKVGYSDHTIGVEAAVGAVALGAEIIEKHLTLDRTQEGPDHLASAEPDVFRSMVESIRKVQTQLGAGVKHPMPSEMKAIEIMRERIKWQSS